MALDNINKFAILFTVAFVGMVYVVITVQLTSFSTTEKFLIALVSGIIISIRGFLSYRKNPINRPFIMTDRSYLLFFIIGIFFGVTIHTGIGTAYGIDYQNTEPTSFFYGILLAFGGYAGFYFFTAMSMVVSIIHIPIINRRLRENTRWFPCIDGVGLGFGIMAFSQLLWKGIPKLWFILS